MLSYNGGQGVGEESVDKWIEQQYSQVCWTKMGKHHI